MLQDAYLKYTRKHEAELDQLRAAISGNKEDKGQSAAQRKHLQKERLGRLKARLSRGLDDDQVYAWMQQRQFRSTLQQARFALANEKYEKHLEASLSQHQVVLNPVK
jgi:DNA-binding transcriptional MerR regulator